MIPLGDYAADAMRSRIDAYRQRGGMLFNGFTVADDIEAALYKAVPQADADNLHQEALAIATSIDLGADLGTNCPKIRKRITEILRRLAGAAEPWPDHPGATVDAVAFVEGVKRYPNVDRDVPDLSHADNQAACQGAFINGFKRAMEMRTPPVRGDREAIARIINPQAFDEKYTMKGRMCEQQYALKRADTILSLQVQSHAIDA